ncbi:MAG: hypothetical protein WC755_01520 [Candidatus Woesearchaeota archaeon]|jgi:deoxyribodipyrimidine photolyase
MGFFFNKEREYEKYDAQMHLVSKWINHLHVTDREIHQKHNEMVNYLHHMHKFVQDLSKENELLRRRMQEIEQKNISRDEVHHIVNSKEIAIDTRHIENNIVERLKEAQKPQEVVQNVKKSEEIIEKVPKTETSVPNQELSYSEKLVMNVLFGADSPLSYEAIGSRLNKKAGTIKVYINDLKRKGIDLEEFNGPSNVKLYALANKEKVNKLYNMNSI